MEDKYLHSVWIVLIVSILIIVLYMIYSSQVKEVAAVQAGLQQCVYYENGSKTEIWARDCSPYLYSYKVIQAPVTPAQ